MTEPDRDLREHFARLRSEDARDAPSFPALLARDFVRTPTARSSRLRPLLALAAVVTLAVLLVHARRTSLPSGDVPATPPPALGQWGAPTDFLLDTPGRELLATVPSLESNLMERSLPR